MQVASCSAKLQVAEMLQRSPEKYADIEASESLHCASGWELQAALSASGSAQAHRQEPPLLEREGLLRLLCGSAPPPPSWLRV